MRAQGRDVHGRPAAALPVLLLVALGLWLTRRGPVLWTRRFVRPPVSPAHPTGEVATAYTFSPPRPEDHEHGWVVPASLSGLVMEFLPALWSVARGHLRLVGLPPRGPELLRVHAAQCPALLGGPAGLITELALCDRGQLVPEDRVLVDAYQTQTSDSLANAKRVGRFLFRSLTGWAAAPVTPAVAVAGVPGACVEPLTGDLDLSAGPRPSDREPPESLAL